MDEVMQKVDVIFSTKASVVREKKLREFRAVITHEGHEVGELEFVYIPSISPGTWFLKEVKIADLYEDILGDALRLAIEFMQEHGRLSLLLVTHVNEESSFGSIDDVGSFYESIGLLPIGDTRSVFAWPLGYDVKCSECGELKD